MARSSPHSGATTRSGRERVVAAMPSPIPVQIVNSGWANGPMTPAHEEDRDEPRAATLAERATEVEDVLGEREPGGADARVDHAVDDPVELPPPEQQDQQHRRALERLLDDRRDGHRGHGQRVLLHLLQQHDRGRVEDQRAGAGHERAPAEREQQQRHRLGLEPVEPEERRYDDAERQHREDQTEQRGLDAGIGADGSGEDEATHGEADQDHRELHPAPDHRPAGGVERPRWERLLPSDLRRPGLSPRHAPQGSRSPPLQCPRGPERKRTRTH